MYTLFPLFSKIGDRSGRLLIGRNQSLYVANAHLPLNVDVYQGGLATLQGELEVAGVTINVEGVLENAENITVADGGKYIHFAWDSSYSQRTYN